MKKYIDLLLVEDEAKCQHLVSAPTCKASDGSIVRFADGAMGTVTKKAFMDSEGEAYDLISSMLPVFNAEAIYAPAWKKEDADAPA